MHRDAQSGSILGLCNLSALHEKVLCSLWLNSMRNYKVFISQLMLLLYKANRTISYFWDKVFELFYQILASNGTLNVQQSEVQVLVFCFNGFARICAWLQPRYSLPPTMDASGRVANVYRIYRVFFSEWYFPFSNFDAVYYIRFSLCNARSETE